MSVEWCPTDEMTGYFWTQPNQGYIFKIFRYLIMGVMPQTDPNNGEQGKKIKLRILIKSKRRSGRRDKYHKLPQVCVTDRHTDCNQNRI